MQIKKLRRKEYLINPDLIRGLRKWYEELKGRKGFEFFATKRIEMLQLLLNANSLVKNIDSLTKTDRISKSVFNEKLARNINHPVISDLKIKSSKGVLKEEIKSFYEKNNLLRLYLVSARFWLLKSNKWKIAFSNLNNILNALQIIQYDLELMQRYMKDKKFADSFEKPIYEHYSSELGEIKEVFEAEPKASDFWKWVDCDSYVDRIFSPEPGGLYHISRIEDIDGNDIFSRLVCKDEIIVLKGEFTYEDHPENVFVVVPTKEWYAYAEIIEWHRNEIKIKVPPNAVKGCIFIYNYGAEIDYNNCIKNKLPKILLAESQIDIETDLNIPIIFPIFIGFNSQFEPPECENYPGYLPIIDYIKINGEEAGYTPEHEVTDPWGLITRTVPEEWTPVNVWNEEEVEITFSGTFVEDVIVYKGWRLRILKQDGTSIMDVELDAAVNNFTFTPRLDKSTELTIELCATNRCLKRTIEIVQALEGGTQVAPLIIVDREIKISKMVVKKKPQLKILGVEVTQGIQRYYMPIFDDAVNAIYETINNNVDLIKSRTTVCRVYIDSGIEEDVEDVDEIRVNGTIDFGRGYLKYAENGHTFLARHKFNLDRDNLDHTLNFKLDGYFIDTNSKTFTFRVFHPGREGRAGFEDTHSITMNFNTGHGFDLCIVLYDDEHEGHERTVNHDGRSDDEIRWDAIDVITHFFPIPDDGIDLYLPSNEEDIHKSTRRDLMRNDKKGWYRLGGDLENLAEGYEDWEGLVWLGLTPTNSNYRLGGVGWDRNLITHPHAVAQAEADCTIPHEVGHTHEIHHADCGPPGNKPDNIDGYLDDKIPDGRTNHTGVNVYKMYSRSAGCGDLMSYCHPRWTSTALWQYLLEKIEEGA